MAGMFFSGLVAYFIPMAKTYVQLLLCTSGFGLASGAYIGLTVALFADAFGNEKVGSNAATLDDTPGVTPERMAYTLQNLTRLF